MPATASDEFVLGKDEIARDISYYTNKLKESQNKAKDEEMLEAWNTEVKWDSSFYANMKLACDIPKLEGVTRAPRHMRDALIVQVESAGYEGGDYAMITLNDTQVDCFMNENGT